MSLIHHSLKLSSLLKPLKNSLNHTILRKYTPRRALMYVPGDDRKKLTKALGLKVDCIAMDCEDGVAINRKGEARKIIRELLNESRTTTQLDLGVRINSVDTEFFKDDLNEVLSAQNLPDTLLLPKVKSPDDLRLFSELLSAKVKGDAKINLIIYIESAESFINLVQICREAQNLGRTNNFVPVALVFGSDDFCANIGASRTEDSQEIVYARQKLVLVAKAFDLQAIDMVYIKFKDLEGLRRQSEEGARMGYTGKQVIHPGQVPIVQQAFLPNPSQVEWAQGLLKAFDQHQKTGKGAFNYKASMIDMPTMKQARNIIELINTTQN